MRRKSRFVAVLLVLAVAMGCASSPAEPAEPEVLFGSVGQNLLILPFNLAVPMPPKLAATSPVVWQEVERYLRDHGKELKAVSEKDGRDFWAKSVAQVRSRQDGGTSGFDDAIRVLVQKLSAHAEFDTVIAASLFIREAPVYQKAAYWDGVDAIGDEARELAEDTPLEGAAPVSSIHIVVLDAMGNKIQEAQGGLDLLVRVRVTTAAGKPEFEFVRRSDVFADRGNIREGVSVALAPFLPRLTPEAK
jgi:hypothetical protein